MKNAFKRLMSERWNLVGFGFARRMISRSMRKGGMETRRSTRSNAGMSGAVALNVAVDIASKV